MTYKYIFKNNDAKIQTKLPLWDSFQYEARWTKMRKIQIMPNFTFLYCGNSLVGLEILSITYRVCSLHLFKTLLPQETVMNENIEIATFVF